MLISTLVSCSTKIKNPCFTHGAGQQLFALRRRDALVKADAPGVNKTFDSYVLYIQSPPLFRFSFFSRPVQFKQKLKKNSFSFHNAKRIAMHNWKESAPKERYELSRNCSYEIHQDPYRPCVSSRRQSVTPGGYTGIQKRRLSD